MHSTPASISPSLQPTLLAVHGPPVDQPIECVQCPTSFVNGQHVVAHDTHLSIPHTTHPSPFGNALNDLIYPFHLRHQLNDTHLPTHLTADQHPSEDDVSSFGQSMSTANHLATPVVAYTIPPTCTHPMQARS